MPFTQRDYQLLNAIRQKRPISEIELSIQSGANINVWTEQGSALHLAVDQENIPLIELLLRRGINIHLTDSQFRTAFDLDKAKRSPAILNLLIRHHASMTENQLSAIIALCLEHYHGTHNHRSSDQLLLDYAASTLVGTNICELRHKKLAGDNATPWQKYKGHLRSLSALDKDKKNVEGFYREDFLALRIRSIFEIIVKIEKGIITSHQLEGAGIKLHSNREENRALVLKLLKQELLSEIETLQMFRYSLCELISPQLIVENILYKLNNNPDNTEYSLAVRWQWMDNTNNTTKAHAVYVNPMKRSGILIFRVDNLGFASDRLYWDTVLKKHLNLHRKDSKQGRIQNGAFVNDVYPCVLQHVTPKSYLESLINVNRQLLPSEKQGFSLIYNLAQPSDQGVTRDPIELKLPSFSLQTVGNCALEGHQIGLRVRLNDQRLYEWFVQIEKSISDEIIVDSPRHIFSADSIKTYQALAQGQRGLPLSLQQHLREYYQKVVVRTPLPGSLPVSIIEPVLSLTTSDEQKNTTLAECMNLYPRLLITALSGRGKSTICLYAASQWASGHLAPHLKWICHISFQDFKNYEPLGGNQDYTLVDVCKKVYANIGINIVDINAVNKDEVLWVIDGFESFSALPPYLRTACQELFSAKHIIVTTRPYDSRAELSNIKEVELQEYSDKKIEKFIENYFATQVVLSKSLQTYLKENSILWNLAHNPIALYLICYAWHNISKGHNGQKLETISELYTTIVDYIQTHFYSSQVLGTKDRKSIIKTLEWIAFSAFLPDSTGIIKANIQWGYKQIFSNVAGREYNNANEHIIISQILSTGLLQVNFQDVRGEAIRYDLFHQTMGEFLAAGCVSRALKRTGSIPLPKGVSVDVSEFIKTYRFNPHFVNIWRFTAGKLIGDISALDAFFNLLMLPCSEDERHAQIIVLMQCFEEVKLTAQLSIHEFILSEIRSYIANSLLLYSDFQERPPYSHDLLYNFSRQLNTCPCIFAATQDLWLSGLYSDTDNYMHRRRATYLITRLSPDFLLRFPALIDALFYVLDAYSGNLMFSISNPAAFVLSEIAIRDVSVLNRYLDSYTLRGIETYRCNMLNFQKLDVSEQEVRQVVLIKKDKILNFLSVDQLVTLAKLDVKFREHLIGLATQSMQSDYNLSDAAVLRSPIYALMQLTIFNPIFIDNLVFSLGWHTEWKDYGVVEDALVYSINVGADPRILMSKIMEKLRKSDWQAHASFVKIAARITQTNLSRIGTSNEVIFMLLQAYKYSAENDCHLQEFSVVDILLDAFIKLATADPTVTNRLAQHDRNVANLVRERMSNISASAQPYRGAFFNSHLPQVPQERLPNTNGEVSLNNV